MIDDAALRRRNLRGIPENAPLWRVFKLRYLLPTIRDQEHSRYVVTDPTRFQTTAADYNAGRDEGRPANPEQISLVAGAAVLVNH